jgi:hypothetical protein
VPHRGPRRGSHQSPSRSRLRMAEHRAIVDGVIAGENAHYFTDTEAA